MLNSEFIKWCAELAKQQYHGNIRELKAALSNPTKEDHTFQSIKDLIPQIA